jgi:hypothetical protein
VGKVTDGDYKTHYGAGLGFQLCDPGSSAMPLTLGNCSLGTSLTGLRFLVTGKDIPPELRVVMNEPTRAAPAFIYAFPDRNVVSLADARVFYDASGPAVDVAGIQSISFTVPSNGNADVPFDFCIEEIEAVNPGACSATGTGGAGGQSHVLYGFDSSSQGFVLSDYATPDNLGWSGSGSSPKLTWDASVGDPTNGSLRVEVTYTDYGQHVDAILPLAVTTDFTGKLLRARVRVDSGSFAGGRMTLHALAGTPLVWASGPYIAPSAGAWSELFFDTRTVDGTFDPSRTVQLGLQIMDGISPSAGAVFPGPSTVVFHLDTLSD